MNSVMHEEAQSEGAAQFHLFLSQAFPPCAQQDLLTVLFSLCCVLHGSAVKEAERHKAAQVQLEFLLLCCLLRLMHTLLRGLQL